MGQDTLKDKMKAQMMDWIYEKANDSNIDYNQNLVGLGVQSIEIMELVSMFKREGLVIKFSQLIEKPTLSCWIKLIESATVRHEKSKA